MKATLKVVSLQQGQKVERSTDPKVKPTVTPTIHMRATDGSITINFVNADPKVAEGLSLGSDFPLQFGK